MHAPAPVSDGLRQRNPEEIKGVAKGGIEDKKAGCSLVHTVSNDELNAETNNRQSKSY